MTNFYTKYGPLHSVDSKRNKSQREISVSLKQFTHGIQKAFYFDFQRFCCVSLYSPMSFESLFFTILQSVVKQA